MKAIILAGGFGTRLKSIVKDIPKPMADINGKPFLEYLLIYLEKQGVNEVILSVGYKYEVIQEYFVDKYHNITIKYSIEKEPLGTGGAIKKALQLIKGDVPVFILNGDTFYNINLEIIKDFYNKKNNNNIDIVISLKRMYNFDRYGTIILDQQNRIISFEEKKQVNEGLINAGVYLIKPAIFDGLNLPDYFSFEKDFLEVYYLTKHFYGLIFEEYFIDIGIPEDYIKAQKEIPNIIGSSK